MVLDTALLAIIITVLIAMLGLAATLGALHQKVSRNVKDISFNRSETRKLIDELRLENKVDHGLIFNKLDELNKYLRNEHK